MQLNERLVNSFELTALDSDLIIFRKSREERLIFKKMQRNDCYFSILKPNLGGFLIADKEIHELFDKAMRHLRKFQFESAEMVLKQILIRTRSQFKPADILSKRIEEKREEHKARELGNSLKDTKSYGKDNK